MGKRKADDVPAPPSGAKKHRKRVGRKPDDPSKPVWNQFQAIDSLFEEVEAILRSPSVITPSIPATSTIRKIPDLFTKKPRSSIFESPGRSQPLISAEPDTEELVRKTQRKMSLELENVSQKLDNLKSLVMVILGKISGLSETKVHSLQQELGELRGGSQQSIESMFEIILAKIRALKHHRHRKLQLSMSVWQKIKDGMAQVPERLKKAKAIISDLEDKVMSLQQKGDQLEKNRRLVEEKLQDLENYNRRSNL
ncbi:hypothetical protein NDU88_001909 [Pleurodeles waltl]|uniref:Centromere protein Q n=1 Tax=Pleurodeles waltl TaxID=8319 RepID=A0AAV7TJN6_PLEWA|nr:hypothetical protein NDU88_001909 [Pleurodeles waltl]